MGKVFTQFTMSLDGFIAGPNDEIDLATRHFAAAGLKPAAESSKSPQRLVFSACTPGCRPSVI